MSSLIPFPLPIPGATSSPGQGGTTSKSSSSQGQAGWTFTYRPEDVIPSGVISERSPGKAIANAITEIQRKAVIAVGDVSLSGISGSVSIKGNRLSINLSVDDQAAEADAKGLKVIGDGQTIEVTETSQDATVAVVDKENADTYQVFQKKADGTFGFDFVRFHD